MSYRTSNFGPRVSYTTTLADPGPVHVYGDSNATLEWDGRVNLQSATLLSRNTTASHTSLTLADGEFAIGSLSATSLVLNFRSGNTTYTIIADAASVL